MLWISRWRFYDYTHYQLNAQRQVFILCFDSSRREIKLLVVAVLHPVFPLNVFAKRCIKISDTVLPELWVPGGAEPSDPRSEDQVRFLKRCWWTPPPSRSPARSPSGRPATWPPTPGAEEGWRGEETAAAEESLEINSQYQRLTLNHQWFSLKCVPS